MPSLTMRIGVLSYATVVDQCDAKIYLSHLLSFYHNNNNYYCVIHHMHVIPNIMIIVTLLSAACAVRKDQL